MVALRTNVNSVPCLVPSRVQPVFLGQRHHVDQANDTIPLKQVTSFHIQRHTVKCVVMIWRCCKKSLLCRESYRIASYVKGVTDNIFFMIPFIDISSFYINITFEVLQNHGCSSQTCACVLDLFMNINRRKHESWYKYALALARTFRSPIQFVLTIIILQMRPTKESCKSSRVISIQYFNK